MLIFGGLGFARPGFNGTGTLQWMMLSIAWHKGQGLDLLVARVETFNRLLFLQIWDLNCWLFGISWGSSYKSAGGEDELTHDVEAKPFRGDGDMQQAILHGSLRGACRIRKGMSITH